MANPELFYGTPSFIKYIPYRFQFHTGAINTAEVAEKLFHRAKFQFHTGAINTTAAIAC
jgi:hypothetical protein